jgi:glycosyltransferase involved in cell wall biosynthesis
MTCIEAAYFGTPLIATRCGGPEEIIKHKETGLLVAVADIDAMTEAILTLAADKELRLNYAKAGMAYVREKFSKEDFITRFQKMLTT